MPDQRETSEPHDHHRPWGLGFEQFYRAHFADVVAHLVARRTQPSDAFDIAQDLFISLGNKWDELPKRASNSAYIRASARHRQVDHYRKPHIKREVLVDHDLLDTVMADDSAATGAEGSAGDIYDDLLEAAQKHLPAQQCRAFLLMVSGMKYSEIAAEMELTSGAIATHISKARKKLRSIAVEAVMRGDWA
ncbi:RNA polymerase sigma factor [Streptomyces goshikiensis]|uniref:RNA polymerase sigma factor n=1 Tax=Streptomyces goshikiensis TaxID=1942 RepID=UPI00365CC01F